MEGRPVQHWAATKERSHLPGKRTHDPIGFLVSPAIGAGVYALTGSAGAAGVAFGAHLAGTFMLSPDLDLEDSGLAHRWGALRLLWVPYGKAIPHRSPLSHSGISAVIRVAYLALVLESLLFLIGITGLINWASINEAIGSWISHHPEIVIFGIIGLITGDLTHTITDRIVTKFKRAL